MLCDVCKRCLEGMNDPTVTPRHRVIRGYTSRHTPRRTSRRTSFEFEKYEFGHHRTRESLVQAIEQQCLLCLICKKYMHDIKPANDNYFTTFTASFVGGTLCVFPNWNRDRCSLMSLLIPLKIKQEYPEMDLKLDDNTGGQYTQNLIYDWDRNCDVKHLRCGKFGDSAFLPTRMLEIEDISNPTACSLVLREEVPPASRYIALSYCWGNVKKEGRICLSQSTFDTIRARVLLVSLPKTYTDAIQVTARLGIRYIWIDALCIIQDSSHDWRKEASTMQAVYRNSYLTISALAGAHDNSGLFYPRDPFKIQRTVVHITFTPCDKPKPFLHSSEPQAAQDSWEVGNVTTKRAWCLQERLLPSRVLHFGLQQVFWECHEQHASESSPSSMRFENENIGSRRERTRVWKLLIGETQILDARDPYQDLVTEWYAVLSYYSSCQLTHASDKLVAISGLANDMRSALNTHRPNIHHTYLAGLWAEDLRFGMCWSLKRFGKRPAIYRAPFWSPMSLDGSTDWDSPPTSDKFTWFVGDADFTAVTHCMDGLDTGEVTGGQLKLRGPWTNIRTVKTKAIDEGLNVRRLSYFQFLDPVLSFETYLIAEDDSFVFYDTKDDIIEQAFCMPIFTRASEKGLWSFQGLVLVPVEDGCWKYRRIGLIKGSYTAEKAHIFLSRCEKRSVTVI